MSTINPNDTDPFYSGVADFYHLFYRDWQAAMEREGAALRRLFRAREVKRILDASCGTGTQTIGLARSGYTVTAADPSQAMLDKAHQNAAQFNVSARIEFVKADFLSLPSIVEGPFDAVVTKGNALPHLLTDGELLAALKGFYGLLRPGGTAVIGIRDFDILLEDRPRFVPRHAHMDDPQRDVILFDVWDWDDGPPVVVTFNTFIVTGKGQQYTAQRHPVKYRALRRDELLALMAQAGFVDVTVENQAWEIMAVGNRPG